MQQQGSFLRKYDNISPVLHSLHWLPVKYGIDFKILLLTYKTLNNMAPSYLTELLNKYVPQRENMRSNNAMSLHVPRSKLITAGDISFSVASPTLWNQLPYHIQCATSVTSFKNLLKTHLFCKAFTQIVNF